VVDLLALVLGRPNAVDAEVSRLSAHALLTAPPVVLVDAARASAAARLENFRVPVWIATIAVQVGVLAWFWSTGRSAALRDALRRRIGSEFGVRFCFGASLAALDRAAAFVPQALQYRFLRLMDLSELLFRTWLAHWLAGSLVTVLVVGFTAAIVLGLADRTHQWYLYTIAGVMSFTLLISYATPAILAPASEQFLRFAPRSPLAGAVLRLRRRTGVTIPLYVEVLSRRTRSGRAYVLGWGDSQRGILSDTLIAGSTDGELEYFVARLFAWVLANFGLQNALVQAAFIVVGAALSVLIADRIGFRRDDDPVSRLALLGAVIGCVYFVALPFYNGYARRADLVIDAAAVGLAGDRSAAIRAQVRAADQNLERVCPSRFAQWYLSASPSLGERIAALQGRPDECLRRR